MTDKENREIQMKLVNATNWLVVVTSLLAVATLALVFIGYSQYTVDSKMSDITADFYTYHPPDVSVIDGYVTNLYVLKNNSTKTYISVVGLSTVYNSALSDDIAVIKKQNLGKSYKPFKDEKMVAYIVDLATGDILQQQEISLSTNDSINVEGSTFSIPINSGESEYIPILMSYVSEIPIEENSTINLEVNQSATKLEVIHPINKSILSILTAIPPTNITYVMGEDNAIVKTDNKTQYKANVRYTEDEKTYHEWKNQFLLQYGKGALVV